MSNDIIINKKAISVKNAVLVTTKDFIYIVHYDTIILKMNKVTNKVLILLPVSMSSQNAIVEGLISLGFTYRYIYDTIFSKVEELNGLTKSELMKMWKFKRYEVSPKRRKAEIENVVNELIAGDLA